MIKEALQYLAELGKASVAPMKVDIKDPERVTYLIGDKTISIAVANYRDHAVNDLDSLIKSAETESATSPVIWVGETDVVLILDDSDTRCEQVTLTLNHTAVFRRLLELRASSPWFEPKAFRRLLRVELYGALESSVLYDRVARIRFEAGQVTSQETSRSKESIGKQLKTEVSADGELPEDVVLTCPVYEDQEEFAICCALEVDAARGMLQLVPFPDEIQRVTKLAQQDIKTKIEAKVPQVPVYLGTP